MSYSDLGCFGGEIRTPCLDHISRKWLLFHAIPQPNSMRNHSLIKTPILTSLCLAALTACKSGSTELNVRKHNILLIYADDLGYGDIGLNRASGVKTPNIHSLAINGLLLTDAHCSEATSTPSRYSLLTGRYAFSNNAAILPGDASLLIDTNITTLPNMLKTAGYKTGVIGKWHLGLGLGKINWNEDISPGPFEIGFDYSFLLQATCDRVPCVFLENQKVVGPDPNDPIQVSYSEKLEGYHWDNSRDYSSNLSIL